MKNYYVAKPYILSDKEIRDEFLNIDNIREAVESIEKEGGYSISSLDKYNEYVNAMAVLINIINKHTLNYYLSKSTFENRQDLAIHCVLTDPKFFRVSYKLAEYFRINLFHDPHIKKSFEESYYYLKGLDEEEMKEEIEEVRESTTYDLLSWVLRNWEKYIENAVSTILSEEELACFEVLRETVVFHNLLHAYISEWNDLIYGVSEFILEEILGLSEENA